MILKGLLSVGKFKLLTLATSMVLVAGTAAYYFSDKTSKTFKASFDSAFKPYISGYTGGVVSKESPVFISFTSELVTADQLNQPLENSIFDFSPSLKGSVAWIDKSTIRFQPSEPMESGKVYDVAFQMGQVMQMPEEMQEFQFNFQVMEQNYDVVFEGLRFYENGKKTKEKLIGSVRTSDVAGNEVVEKILSANQQGKSLPIKWTHNPDRLSHTFEIDSVSRTSEKGKVTVNWNGNSIGAEKSGSQEYEIPAIGNFELLSSTIVQGDEQYVKLEFSDPISSNQDLEGLVILRGVGSARIVSDKNILKVYPPVRQTGVKTLVINAGVRNADGKKLGKTENLSVLFEEIKPAVRLTGKGVILPGTDGMIFPFEAVSLRSVNVQIIKIHENNINQFFQVNNFSGNDQIRRVGSIVMRKTISLNNTNPNDYSRWKKYALDLSELIQGEPGAIYQVKLSFKSKNTWYSCGESSKNKSESLTTLEDEEDDYSETENSYWDYADDYYYATDYNYSERNNPCSPSYYGDYRSVKRNIFASDIAVIAKKGAAGEFLIAVTDIKTTQPVSGATIELYDYQQQLITKVTTDEEGLAKVKPVKTPYFLSAVKGNQRGYLKLDDASSLSITGFDVSGEKVNNGIKGFIYGERGVWRPGDSLYLTFVLENKLQTLPENQPVIFELLNPMGQVVKKMISATPVNGFYNFSTTTAESDPTGNWMARVKVGGAVFTKQLKIETIKPNRLKIKVDFGEDKITASNSTILGDLEVKWLHGAIARNLKTDISMVLSQANTSFKKYEEYTFDDPGRTFSSETIEIFNGQVDENGKATVKASVQTEGVSPGALNAKFKIKVFEEGGDFSTDHFSIPYYPYNSFVGIRTPKGDAVRNMLLTDTNHTVSIVTVNDEGKPVSGRDIEMTVYKLDWKWWWDKSEDDLSNVLESRYKRPIVTETLTSINGKANWNFRINYPEWGRYYIRAYDKASKHSTGKIVYIDWPGWAGKSRENTNGSTSRLNFAADKADYKVGEKVNLTIPGGANGRALVSIESGSKVLETYWMETKSGKNSFEFTTTKDMAPNVYVNVTLIQPHAQTANDLPIRLYGVIPIKVEDPATVLEPVITTAEEYRPEEKVNISVSEATGKPMTYTLAVVDEGLLDLTRFSTPAPWSHFYKREALGVKSFDMYEYVIGALGQKVDRILSIGGDAELTKKDGSKTKRFPPVVKYLGPFSLEEGETADHSFTMPQYVGSVRVMVVAGDPKGSYGNTEKAVPVRKPLMLLSTLPRVLGPEEYVALPVNVFAMTSDVKKVSLEVKTDALLQVMDEGKKQVTFAQPGDEVVNFYLKAKPTTGTSKVIVTARSGREKATYVINIAIRNPNNEVTKVEEKLLQANQSADFTYEAFGVAGTNSAVLEVSSIPPINLEKRLKYLIKYPYGCVEQTTSSVFPQLYVMDIIEPDNGLASRIEGNVKSGIQRLRSFQLPEGGFGYWPGAEEYSAWSTSYAGHFIIEAEKKGYALPAGMKDQWLRFQKKMARNWSKGGYKTDLVQAYRLYTLALAGEPENGAMNRLREKGDLSSSAAWRLAAAYKLAGQEEAANSLVRNASLVVEDYSEMDNTFGNGTRDKAMILEVLTLMNKQTEGVQMLKELSAELSSQKWMSTQTTAYSLLAVSKFINNGIKASKVDFAYSVNGGKTINATTDLKIAQVDLKALQNGKVSIKNTSTGTLYTRLISTGVPVAGEEQAEENHLSLKVAYKTKDGKALDPERMVQGTDFVAEVTVSNPGTRGDLKNVALKQIFASGWEIHNYRMDGGVSAQESSIPTYQDIRDDRVYTHFDLKAKESKVFRISLNSSYLGKYYLPSVYCEAMYDGTINATVPGKWVEVVKPGNEGDISFVD